MADLSYKKLTKDEQLTMVGNQLMNLERQHYTERLNLIQAPDEGSVDASRSRLDALEKSITDLRDEESGLKPSAAEKKS